MDLKRPRAILFDWDNTLVDTWPAIMDSLNTTLAAFDKPVWTLAETRARVRRSMRDSFPALFGERWPEARDIFYRRFESAHLATLREMPGAGATLASMAGDGLYLGVVSNKLGTLLRKEATHMGWDRLFGRMVGASDAPRDKPACEPVILALETSGVAAGPDVWFVGDADVDMECAHAAGCVPILFRPATAEPAEREEFQEFPPSLRVASLNQLVHRLRAL